MAERGSAAVASPSSGNGVGDGGNVCAGAGTDDHLRGDEVWMVDEQIAGRYRAVLPNVKTVCSPWSEAVRDRS